MGPCMKWSAKIHLKHLINVLDVVGRFFNTFKKVLISYIIFFIINITLFGGHRFSEKPNTFWVNTFWPTTVYEYVNMYRYVINVCNM